MVKKPPLGERRIRQIGADNIIFQNQKRTAVIDMSKTEYDKLKHPKPEIIADFGNTVRFKDRRKGAENRNHEG